MAESRIVVVVKERKMDKLVLTRDASHQATSHVITLLPRLLHEDRDVSKSMTRNSIKKCCNDVEVRSQQRSLHIPCFVCSLLVGGERH